MARGIDHFNLFGRTRKLYLRLNHFRSRPGKRIENHNRYTVPLGIDVSQNLVERTMRELVGRTGNIFQISLGVEIVHRDSGTGHDIVEVIEEQILPGELELILCIRPAEEGGHGRILLRVEHQFFIMTNSLFGVRLRRIHAPVIFEIEFVLPGRHFEIWEFLVQVGEKCFRRAEINLRKDGVRIPKAIGLIKHGASRAAAVVADSVQVKHLRRIREL